MSARPWRLPDAPHALKVGALDEFEVLARRFLPRGVFGFARAGVEANGAYERNLASFRDWDLAPRVLRGGPAADTSTEIFGRRYAAPFGIAPMGAVATGRFRGDLELARAAAARNVPLVISGASSMPMEALREACPHAWMQAYMPADRAEASALTARVARAGFEVLVVTVDVPVASNRFHYQRLGFSLPLRPSLALALDGLAHPRWLIGMAAQTLIRDGIPHYENYGPARGAALFSNLPSASRPAKLSWDDLKRIRDEWPGKLVLKGVLCKDDATIAGTAGVDGIVVSNHGGRQLDAAPAPMDVLAEIVAAAPSLTVMLDGGVRWGGDVLKALALGARFAFVGRPFFFANAVGGQAAVERGIDLLCAELARNMVMLGIDRLDELDASYLRPRRR